MEVKLDQLNYDCTFKQFIEQLIIALKAEEIDYLFKSEIEGRHGENQPTIVMIAQSAALKVSENFRVSENSFVQMIYTKTAMQKFVIKTRQFEKNYPFVYFQVIKRTIEIPGNDYGVDMYTFKMTLSPVQFPFIIDGEEEKKVHQMKDPNRHIYVRVIDYTQQDE
jgi:hypothetical protein